MVEEAFPITVCVVGYIILLGASWLTPKNYRTILIFIGGAVTIFGLGMLYFQERQIAFAICLCIFALTAISHYTLNSSQSPIRAQGPYAGYLNQEGVCIQTMAPQGRVEIHGKNLPATSEGLLIQRGDPVRVVRVSDKMVVVEKIS